MTQRRLIEETFPLKKVSEDASHEKMCHSGHIKSLHIWPARRPLAACRAAIIAALMPDPGDEKSRHKLNKKIESLTRWGTENGPALDFFRDEIRKAYGGRAPRVLDMFAGGGAIPLEAMRLGCDVTAIDYNPVAWFILKCTLEFPQKLAGKTWPLPVKDGGRKTGDGGEKQLPLMDIEKGKQGDLADHVRYWGEWVLKHARQELQPYYPTINGQPTVAYLWARTVPCPDPACGAEVPLLKTLWLCKKAEKTLPDTPENRARSDFLRIKRTKNTSKVVINARRALRLLPEKESHQIDFEIWTPEPKNTIPKGTMSGANAVCPLCGVNLPPEYIKECGHDGRIGARMTSVVVDTGHIKEYRIPTIEEEDAAHRAASNLSEIATQIPYGLPEEPLPGPEILGFRVPLYGLKTWADLFTPRQLLALMTIVKWMLEAKQEMSVYKYSENWVEAVIFYLVCVVNKLGDYNSTLVTWQPDGGKGGHTFARWALPMTWDFVESNAITSGSATYQDILRWVTKPLEDLSFAVDAPLPKIIKQSATKLPSLEVDLIVTDPPYYDAIPYADLSDFFYIWIRRALSMFYPEMFQTSLTPKSKELVQQERSKASGRLDKRGYEIAMENAFHQAWEVLNLNGRMVIVFAHKDPEAWETLASAIINSGFNVIASWPLDTEMGNRTRAMKSAALSSSIWMVCRKRPENAGVGRYRAVRQAMEARITERLRYFWDIGISGPDFIWAAVGPALESYSAYDEVRRMDGSPFTVGDFLKEVRRLVADFALGQILKGQSTQGIDEATRYYLMHRDYFGLETAPVGECILLSQGYGLELNDLRGQRGLIVKSSGSDVRLAKWHERTRDDLGEPHPSGGLPMIDIIHRLIHLWSAGDLSALKDYANSKGIGQNDLFWAVAQAVLEMAPTKSRERALLEAVVAWGRGKSEPQVLFQTDMFEDPS